MVIVKQVINYIAKPLAHVCSKSFECGVFPDNMKVAKEIPLSKATVVYFQTIYTRITVIPIFKNIEEI